MSEKVVELQERIEKMRKLVLQSNEDARVLRDQIREVERELSCQRGTVFSTVELRCLFADDSVRAHQVEVYGVSVLEPTQAMGLEIDMSRGRSDLKIVSKTSGGRVSLQMEALPDTNAFFTVFDNELDEALEYDVYFHEDRQHAEAYVIQRRLEIADETP